MRGKVDAVQRMQDYIERHLNEPVTLQKLAKAAGYTASHASRVFKELAGIPPLDYLRARRLSRAAERLRNHPDRILDVALDAMFGSHEGFTRAFSKQFGITPEYYRKNTPPIPLFMPRSARDYYLYYLKGATETMEKSCEKNSVNTIFVQVIERPARKLIIQRGKKATQLF